MTGEIEANPEKQESSGDAGTRGRSETPGLKHAWDRLQNGFLQFLEIIGLRKERRDDSEAQLARLRFHHAEFRQLITSNDSFLNILADIETRQAEGEYIDRRHLERQTMQASVHASRMAKSLAELSGDRYPALLHAHERITDRLGRLFDDDRKRSRTDLVLDFSQIGEGGVELAGGKLANLAQIRNRLGLPVPDGFVVTVEAYRRVAEECGVAAALRQGTPLMEEVSPAGAGAIAGLAERLQECSLPARLVAEIHEAYDRLTARLGEAPLVSVRSSAMGEDSYRSFAGQFLTVLSVQRDNLIPAYLKVLASLFSPEAIHYRNLHRIPHEFAGMAVGVLQMVDAAASGVAFTEDPSRPGLGHILIHAVCGLGATLVEGKTLPEVVAVDRKHGMSVVSRRTPPADNGALSPDEGAEIEDEGIEARADRGPALPDEKALLLAQWALRLEEHFRCPQDIEWAMDTRGQLVILQSRPLRFSSTEAQSGPPEPDAAVILSGGDIASPGVGWGPAVLMDENSDLETFPNGAVLVIPRSSPRFVRLMSQASAIVADMGSTTGHMASLAREFHVPAILGLRRATRAIRAGQVITVDARKGYVYDGKVSTLLHCEQGDRRIRPGDRPAAASPPPQLLREVTALLLPLTLTDPRSPDFRAENCKTLHDLARFAHEKCYEEMFRKGEGMGDMREVCYFLDVFLPIDLYILDLGGGLKPDIPGHKIKPSHIASAPLCALLAGMLDRRLPRFGPRPMDLGGFLSIMMRHAIHSPESERTFRDPSYAMISDRYMNYAARVGYHFGVVDSYCGRTPNKNYISVHFRGGAADFVRRSRRARAVAGILREFGFLTEVKGDAVSGRLSKCSQEETARQLEMIGRLLQFARQMDISMVSEESVAWFCEAFLSGDFKMERTRLKTGETAIP